MKAFIELLKLLGIKSALSTVYHPQTDGTTERTNQEIEAYLSIYCASHPEDWAQSLHTLEFTHNNRRHADRQNTPFELMFGESPVAIPLSFENMKYPTMEDKMKTLLRNREEALAAHELARSRMTDRQKLTFTPFKKDDQVWLDSRNLKTISQEDETETRRTLQNHRSSRPIDIPITTTDLMEKDRKSTRLNSSHALTSRMPSSA